MTTGVPIYLVSACASAEEFVAAFRRYADKTGLFIPMAEPLPAGRTGRLALTLKDGGVMIEGVAQVVTSSNKPLGLYGRPGITVKFTEPDDPSKQVIAELEKARLALRPLPPSVPPRKAEVPAEPRPKPPAIVGRIDAANALAETVAIGDVALLKETAGDANASGGLPKAGQKFVVPSIPATPGSAPMTRAKTPTKPPIERAERAKPPTKPPPEAKAEDPRPKSPTGPPSQAGLALADKLKSAEPPRPRPKTTPPPTPAAPPGGKRKTMIGMPAVDKLPVEKLTATPPPPPKPTTLGMQPMKVTQTQPLPLVPPADVGVDLKQTVKGPAPATPAAPRRSHSPSQGPPMPRHPTPAAPLPVARLPARMAAMISADPVEIESTDITTVPEPALPPAEAKVEDKVEAKPEEPKPVQRSGGMRASEIMAAIPTDDWTMSPDQSAPVVLPSSEKIVPTPAAGSPPIVVEAKSPPKGPPTGDWTIQADPSAPDGWAPPAKLAKGAPPPAAETPSAAAARAATGNPVHAVSSKKELDIQEWEDKPTGIGQPLVEIDSTLMEPLKPMPLLDEPMPAPAAVAQTGASPVLPEQPRQMRAQTGPVQFENGVPPPLVGNVARNATGPAPVLAGTAAQAGAAHAAHAPTEPAGVAPLSPGLAQTQPVGLVPTQSPQAGFENVGTPPPLAPPPVVPPPPLNPAYTGPMPQATGSQQQYPAFDGQQQVQMMGFPRMASDAGSGFFRDSEAAPRYPTGHDAAENTRRKRVLMIAVGSAVAAVALVVLIIMMTGGKKTSAATAAHGKQPIATTAGSGSGSSDVAAVTGSGSAAGPGSAVEAVKTPEPAPTPPPGPEEPSKPDTCKVEVKSDPPGALINVDKDNLGTTPATIELPCGTESKLKIYRRGYFGVVKAVTPTAEGAKVEVALASAIFTVKVTSAPAGATVTVGGKPMGVTPTTIKLPAFSASTVVISKDGFTPDTQKVTPKQNGVSHHVLLKKLSGRTRK